MAERDIRSKVDGVDRLTERRLDEMLDKAATVTKTQVTTAISDLQSANEGAADILRALLIQVEGRLVDADTVAALEAASYRLANLDEHTPRESPRSLGKS
ncbi:hypothetical protein [Actinokineospora globicatena]|uniref:Uncharacterized protein n=1 Tax=Actinokineospora globicatena TaxID=103729 RepID=A0A9W6V8P4_9PSEU|nr:hypothetical protein [Actinokineospora globicatena]GLW91174.1 hypothetical protein Aglo03_19900 [Actinokineospora globicatena]